MYEYISYQITNIDNKKKPCFLQGFKTNLAPLTNALQKIDSINPVYFYFDTVAYPNMSFSSKKQVGFIAQNADSVLPKVVQKK